MHFGENRHTVGDFYLESIHRKSAILLMELDAAVSQTSIHVAAVSPPRPRTCKWTDLGMTCRDLHPRTDGG